MAVDINKGTHKIAFPNKLLAMMGGRHTYNVTLAANHDNGELILRTTKWNSFDNYDEATNGTITFAGYIQGQAADGTWYIEVTADTDALLVYNTPVSPYVEFELKDDALFYNAKDETVEGISLAKGDIFSVSTNGFNGTPVAGKTVSYSNGKYVVANS